VILHQSQWPEGLRPLACWDRGFESHWGRGCLSFESVVCCLGYIKKYADSETRGKIVYFRRLVLARVQLPGLRLLTVRDKELQRQKWNCWDLRQATPFMTTNKRLHTPWTTDYMHTGQDRWIQTELAFTLAKNATKPNPFEIISL